MKKKILLLGYGQMAETALRSLLRKFFVVGVVTPAIDSSLYRLTEILPVENLAAKEKIPIYQNNSLSEIKKIIAKFRPDGVVIASYNKVLPKDILTLSKLINVHHGDLPRWRGRANLNWAIITGRSEVGITIHDASINLDSGNIYAQYMIVISARETIKTIYDKVNTVLDKYLAEVVEKVLNGYKGYPQKGKATYCCTRLPEDGLIDWNCSTLEIDRLIRALTHPFPGAFSYLDGSKITIWDAEVLKKPLLYEGRIPGRVIAIHPGIGVEVLTGDRSIIIKNISYKGRVIMADEVIRSVKKTLGINFSVEYDLLLDRLKRLEEKKTS